MAVRYFALLREAAGEETETVELEREAPSVGDLLDALADRGGSLGDVIRRRPVLCAMDMNYAGRDTLLEEGKEVALFPPVSGG